jgi:5-methylcytosine-specific restriction endonuclease McrA
MNEKRCPKCRETKLFAEFGLSAQRKDGLRSWCKVCHNAANATWRKKAPDYYKVRHDGNPERRKKYDTTYKKKNPTFFKDYYEENKHDFIERVNRRRGRAKCATTLWADKEKIRLLYRVSSNLNRLHGYVKYHVDHIVPLQGELVSGLHVHNNLQIIRAEENKTKYNKWKI